MTSTNQLLEAIEKWHRNNGGHKIIKKKNFQI